MTIMVDFRCSEDLLQLSIQSPIFYVGAPRKKRPLGNEEEEEEEEEKKQKEEEREGRGKKNYILEE